MTISALSAVVPARRDAGVLIMAEHRTRLRRVRWRVALVAVALPLAVAGLVTVAAAWLGYRTAAPARVETLIWCSLWLGLAGLVPSALAVLLCRHWHRHAVACGAAALGMLTGAMAFGVALVLLLGVERAQAASGEHGAVMEWMPSDAGAGRRGPGPGHSPAAWNAIGLKKCRL